MSTTPNDFREQRVIYVELPVSRQLLTRIPWRQASETIKRDVERAAEQAIHDAFHAERGFACGGINPLEEFCPVHDLGREFVECTCE